MLKLTSYNRFRASHNIIIYQNRLKVNEKYVKIFTNSKIKIKRGAFPTGICSPLIYVKRILILLLPLLQTASYTDPHRIHSVPEDLRDYPAR